MVRRTHTIGVVLGATPKLFPKLGFGVKVNHSPADNKNGSAMTTNPEAHGMGTGVAPEVGGHPETFLDPALIYLPGL